MNLLILFESKSPCVYNHEFIYILFKRILLFVIFLEWTKHFFTWNLLKCFLPQPWASIQRCGVWMEDHTRMWCGEWECIWMMRWKITYPVYSRCFGILRKFLDFFFATCVNDLSFSRNLLLFCLPAVWWFIVLVAEL